MKLGCFYKKFGPILVPNIGFALMLSAIFWSHFFYLLVSAFFLPVILTANKIWGWNESAERLSGVVLLMLVLGFVVGPLVMFFIS